MLQPFCMMTLMGQVKARPSYKTGCNVMLKGHAVMFKGLTINSKVSSLSLAYGIKYLLLGPGHNSLRCHPLATSCPADTTATHNKRKAARGFESIYGALAFTML